VQLLQTMRKADQKAQLVSEKSVNALGHELIDRKLYPQALAVLNLNTQNFPKSANTWDSLAEAFFHCGDIPNAVHNYQRALEVDATYSNAAAAKKFIDDHVQK